MAVHVLMCDTCKLLCTSLGLVVSVYSTLNDFQLHDIVNEAFHHTWGESLGQINNDSLPYAKVGVYNRHYVRKCGAYLLIRSCDIVLLYVHCMTGGYYNLGPSDLNMDLRYDDNIISPPRAGSRLMQAHWYDRSTVEPHETRHLSNHAGRTLLFSTRLVSMMTQQEFISQTILQKS